VLGAGLAFSMAKIQEDEKTEARRKNDELTLKPDKERLKVSSS